MQNIARGTNVTNSQQNTYQTVRETLTWQKSTVYIKNSAPHPNVTNNQTEHIQNSARGPNVTSNQIEHKQNSAHGIYVTNSEQNTYKTVHEILTRQTVNRTHTKQCTRL